MQIGRKSVNRNARVPPSACETVPPSKTKNDKNISESERISKSKSREGGLPPVTPSAKTGPMVEIAIFRFSPGNEPAEEKAESDPRNRFCHPMYTCSAPYIWGTVSVLLGFSSRITASACLACFPFVSAYLLAARPPCRASLMQKPYYLYWVY